MAPLLAVEFVRKRQRGTPPSPESVLWLRTNTGQPAPAAAVSVGSKGHGRRGVLGIGVKVRQPLREKEKHGI